MGCKINNESRDTTNDKIYQEGKATYLYSYTKTTTYVDGSKTSIEVYPKQDKLIDVCDVYHLWVFDKKYNMPFGIHPKEHIHAINRGYNMNLAELELLEADYELGDNNAKLDGDTINTYSINDK